MAPVVVPSIIAAWPSEGVTLAEALGRAPVWQDYEAVRARAAAIPLHRQLAGVVNPLTAGEQQLIDSSRAAFAQCERWIREQLTTGALVLTCRKAEVGAERVTVAPGMVRYLKFEWSREIVRLNQTVYCDPRIQAAAATAAPEKPARGKTAKSGKRGRTPRVLERVCDEMRKMDPAELRALTQESMAFEFKASRETCEKARVKVLSENVGN